MLVGRLRDEDKQDDNDAQDDVRKPNIGGLVDEAEHEGRYGKEDAGHKVEDQVDCHGNELQAGDAQFIVCEQAIEDEADAQHHRDDNGGSPHAVEAEDEWGGDQAESADVVEVGMNAGWHETNCFHNNKAFLLAGPAHDDDTGVFCLVRLRYCKRFYIAYTCAGRYTGKKELWITGVAHMMKYGS